MDPTSLALQGGLGLIGELLAQGREAEAQRLLQQARDGFGNIDLPKLQQLAAQTLGPSALEGVHTDPRLAAAQNEALGSYDDVIEGDGLAAQDKAAMNRIGSAITRGASLNRAGLTADMEARGMRGSGADIAAQLSSGQAANQRLSDAGVQQEGIAAQNRMAAIQGKGALAGQMRGQDYSEKSRAAEAADEIARYNANARTGATQYNNSMAQQQFSDAMSRQQGKAGATGPLANSYQQQADSTRQLYAGLGAAAERATAGGSRKKPQEEDDGYGWGY